MNNNKTKTRVVIDTNVWISGLLFGGKPKSILDLFIENKMTVFISEEIISELRRTIIAKFPHYAPQHRTLETLIRRDCKLVRLGAETVTICRDPKDNMVIETALAGGCGLVISGDKDLTSLREYQKVDLITPSRYLEYLSRLV